MRISRSALSVLGAVLAALALAAPSQAGVANAGIASVRSDNPLSGLRMGTFHSETRDPTTDPPSAYLNDPLSVLDADLFAKVVDTPRFRWFGSWIPMHDQGYRQTFKWGVYRTARNYIATVQDGDPNKLVPIAIFRLEPFERAVTTRLPTKAEQREYKEWILEFARGIRDSGARVVLVLQPDMPLTLKMPQKSRIDMDLIAWSAKVFNSLPYTTVYIDAGASDWEKPSTMSWMLRQSGIRNARGFSLNITHYTSNADSIRYGKKIVRDLAKHGVRNKHFVVATGMNGRPFTFQDHTRTFKEGIICATPASQHCVTLGRPPTTDTGDPAADAFLWISRPWYNNATIRTYREMLQIIRTSPYF